MSETSTKHAFRLGGKYGSIGVEIEADTERGTECVAVVNRVQENQRAVLAEKNRRQADRDETDANVKRKEEELEAGWGLAIERARIMAVSGQLLDAAEHLIAHDEGRAGDTPDDEDMHGAWERLKRAVVEARGKEAS